jgi:NAD(P)H-hydrate epimerase
MSLEAVFEHLPVRNPLSHKGNYGKLLAICGSSHYRGAAALSAMGALRCGAGIVTLASTEAVCFTVAGKIPEAVLLPLEEGLEGEIDGGSALKAIETPLQNATAVLLGCGVGQGSHVSEILAYVLEHTDCPVIVDADGINALAANIDILRQKKGPVILTPHPGEMARLTGDPVAEIEAGRSKAAMDFAKAHGVIVVLKGHETIVASPDGGLILNKTGNPGLAKGGSGDILAGMIASFAAQGIDPVYAAACAVHLHGLAADRTAARKSQYAMLPSELLDELAVIFAETGR